MIVDASAVMAIVQDEPHGETCLVAIGTSRSVVRMSAANHFEASIVIDSNRDPIASHRPDDVLRRARIVIEPVTEQQARIARQACRAYGRGSGHPAKLNFGDCFACALARERDEPLLFVGHDLSHTDVHWVLD